MIQQLGLFTKKFSNSNSKVFVIGNFGNGSGKVISHWWSVGKERLVKVIYATGQDANFTTAIDAHRKVKRSFCVFQCTAGLSKKKCSRRGKKKKMKCEPYKYYSFCKNECSWTEANTCPMFLASVLSTYEGMRRTWALSDGNMRRSF